MCNGERQDVLGTMKDERGAAQGTDSRGPVVALPTQPRRHVCACDTAAHRWNGPRGEGRIGEPGGEESVRVRRVHRNVRRAEPGGVDCGERLCRVLLTSAPKVLHRAVVHAGQPFARDADGVGEYKAPDTVGIQRRGLHGNATAPAVAEHVPPFHVERGAQRHQVAHVELDAGCATPMRRR